VKTGSKVEDIVEKTVAFNDKCKFFRLDTPGMCPLRDPIRNIVYCAEPQVGKISRVEAKTAWKFDQKNCATPGFGH